jgi:hypothetical protein
MILKITDEEREHLAKAIRSSSLNDKGYLWNLLKILENK